MQLTYQDYLSQFDMSQAGNENFTKPMSEAEWSRLDEAGKWKSLQDNFTMRKDDPRFEELKAKLGPNFANEDSISLNWTGGKPLSRDMVLDPSKAVDVGNGIMAVNRENWTPLAQHDGDENDLLWALSALSVLAAPGVAGMMGGQGFAGGYAPTGADLLGAAPGQGFGTAAAGQGPTVPLTGGDLPHGTEAPNVYDPAANPTAHYEPLDALERGINGGQPPGGYEPFEANFPGENLPGGDMPYGTEIPNHYAPGADPTAYYVPGGVSDPSWLERAWQAITNPSNLAKLPGLVQALGAAGKPQGGAPGAGGVRGAGGGGMGGYSPTARKPELEMNPYAKTQKTEMAGTLADFLKGAVR